MNLLIYTLRKKICTTAQINKFINNNKEEKGKDQNSDVSLNFQ
jgi:hypothetical protein